MVEHLIQELKKQGCLQWGGEDGNASPVKDILFYRTDRDQIYSVTVATSEYLDHARNHNSQVGDPDLRLDENVLVLDDISDLGKVCDKLTSVPFEEIEPFVSAQKASNQVEENSGDGDRENVDRFEV